MCATQSEQLKAKAFPFFSSSSEDIREAILFFSGCSEEKGTLVITSELTDQKVRKKALFTCTLVVYTKKRVLVWSLSRLKRSQLKLF